MRNVSLGNHQREPFHKPTWDSLLHTLAVWDSLLFLCCTTHYCTKQHRTEASRRENDDIYRHDKHERSEASSSITLHIVLQHFFL